jgi:hypothetical protein
MTNTCSCENENQFVIYRGSYREIRIRLYIDSQPFDLSNIDNAVEGDEIEVIFCGEDGTTKSVKWSEGDVEIISAEGGYIKAKLADTFTSLLNPGEKQDVEIYVVDENGEPQIWQVEQMITVKRRMCCS